MEFPNGVSFHTGETALSRRKLEEKHFSILLKEGFEEVITPVLEYSTERSCREGDEGIYTFPDRMTGRTLALRWDFTLQIARLAALQMKGRPGIRRWCYRGNVFRPVREHAGQKRQIYQVGAELIGEGSLESTARMIDLAVSLLSASGLTDFALVIGHVGFVEQLMKLVGIPKTGEKAFREILRRKDLSGLQSMARGLSLSREETDTVSRAMYLIGQEKTLVEAENILKKDPDDEVMKELREVLRLAAKARRHILFDLTEPRGFDYYTGIMFQVVVPKIGQEVCRGGRYDNLLDGYGRPTPAVGFAVDLDLVLQSVGGNEQENSNGME